MNTQFLRTLTVLMLGSLSAMTSQADVQATAIQLRCSVEPAQAKFLQDVGYVRGITISQNSGNDTKLTLTTAADAQNPSTKSKEYRNGSLLQQGSSIQASWDTGFTRLNINKTAGAAKYTGQLVLDQDYAYPISCE
jgi:hypothetical protein